MEDLPWPRVVVAAAVGHRTGLVLVLELLKVVEMMVLVRWKVAA